LSENNNPFANALMKLPPTFLQKIDTFLIENLTAFDFLSLLSIHLRLSKSQIYRKIKQKTGVSPSVYIRQKRLSIAYQWLLETDATISEIAAAVGFRNLSYFSRCFSDYFGYPPSGLRAAND